MTISLINLSLGALGLRSRSQLLFLEKHCHRFSAYIYGPILILRRTNVLYDYIFDKFEFECSRTKAKVTMAILYTKTFSSL